MIRINLISGPRNISTALMYAFAQRTDTTVLDEPFYAFYLQQSGIDHPGKADVLTSQSTDEAEISGAILKHRERPILFIKNMAHHMALIDQAFLERVTNIFLIRNPRQIISSYAQVIENPTLSDIGLEYQCSLFQRLKKQGQHPIVIDSGLLLENPESALNQVCSHTGIPFMSEMLHWQPGPKPYDGIWARHWYTNVHKSSGFEKQPTSNRPLPAHLHALSEKAMEYYDELLPFSIRP